MPGIQERYDEALTLNPYALRHDPNHFRTQEMCNTAECMDSGKINFITSQGVLLRMSSVLLFFIPDCLKTQEMCNEAVKKNPWLLEFVPDHVRTQEVCSKVVRLDPWLLKIIPDHLETQETCDKAVTRNPYMLQYVPDWLVTQQQVEPWHDNELIEWCEGYQKRMTQKAQIK